LLNQARVYRLILKLYKTNTPNLKQIGDYAYILDICDTDYHYLVVATLKNNKNNLHNTQPITLTELVQKFATNKYTLYYTNQQIVADFLDEHFDTNESNTIKLTNNMLYVENPKINKKLEERINKTNKLKKTIIKINQNTDKEDRRIKILYINILNKIHKDLYK
jgi:hypothetical protein